MKIKIFAYQVNKKDNVNSKYPVKKHYFVFLMPVLLL